VIFQDFPVPGIFKKKIQDFPGGVGTLVIITALKRRISSYIISLTEITR